MSRVRGQTYVLFTMLFAMGSDISILKAPIAAPVSPFMSSLHLLLFSNSLWVLKRLTELYVNKVSEPGPPYHPYHIIEY